LEKLSRLLKVRRVGRRERRDLDSELKGSSSHLIMEGPSSTFLILPVR
jgi:hypothetical protein